MVLQHFVLNKPWVFPVKPLVVYFLFINLMAFSAYYFTGGKAAASNKQLTKDTDIKNYGILSTILLTTVNAIKRQFSMHAGKYLHSKLYCTLSHNNVLLFRDILCIFFGGKTTKLCV